MARIADCGRSVTMERRRFIETTSLRTQVVGLISEAERRFRGRNVRFRKPRKSDG